MTKEYTDKVEEARKDNEDQIDSLMRDIWTNNTDLEVTDESWLDVCNDDLETDCSRCKKTRDDVGGGMFWDLFLTCLHRFWEVSGRNSKGNSYDNYMNKYKTNHTYITYFHFSAASSDPHRLTYTCRYEVTVCVYRA